MAKTLTIDELSDATRLLADEYRKEDKWWTAFILQSNLDTLVYLQRKAKKWELEAEALKNERDNARKQFGELWNCYMKLLIGGENDGDHDN